MTLATPLELSAAAHRAPPRWLAPVLLLVGVLAVLAPALLVRFASTLPTPQVVQLLPVRRVIPAAELPPVEPVRYVALTPDDARAYNADVPFASGPNPAARPFLFAGAAVDRARATDCLAAAAIYEAGDDATGEKAVAQVVLNRLRHPAFPKTVCGVVFEGATRATGCQFTFTCDGAIARWRPTPAAWARAQGIAAQALAGAVYRPVGYATHYHTDWVVPYWQSSLDKIAKVGTHLFFRWTGWWGTPPAFGRHPGGPEPGIAALTPITGVAVEGEPHDASAGYAAAGAGPAPVAGDPDSFLVTLPAGLAPELWPQLAGKACGDRPRCRYSAWGDRAKTPTILPLAPEQIAATSFSYIRDRATGLERTLWNCQQIPRSDRRQCMKVQVLLPRGAGVLVTPDPGKPLADQTVLRGPAELGGVRRRDPTPPGTAPAPAPSATPPRLRSDTGAIPSPAAAAQRRSAP